MNYNDFGLDFLSNIELEKNFLAKTASVMNAEDEPQLEELNDVQKARLDIISGLKLLEKAVGYIYETTKDTQLKENLKTFLTDVGAYAFEFSKNAETALFEELDFDLPQSEKQALDLVVKFLVGLIEQLSEFLNYDITEQEKQTTRDTFSAVLTFFKTLIV